MHTINQVPFSVFNRKFVVPAISIGMILSSVGCIPMTPKSTESVASTPTETSISSPTTSPTVTSIPTFTPSPPPNPTNTPVASIVTVTPIPTPTSTPTLTLTATPVLQPTLLPASILLEPEDGATFDPNAQIILEWGAVKLSLLDDELYLITISYKHQGQIWTDYAWTQVTNWSAGEHKYLLDLSDDGLFYWSVTLIHKTGTRANGVPEGIALNQSSEERHFLWRKPSTGGDDKENGGIGPELPYP